VAAGNSLFAVADNNRGDGGDHGGVPNRDHGVPNPYRHKKAVRTGLQRRLIELKKVTFSSDFLSKLLGVLFS